MSDQKLSAVIFDDADENNSIDLDIINIIVMTIPEYNRTINDHIQLYFNNELFFSYYVTDLLDDINITVKKSRITEDSYSVYYTITDPKPAANSTKSEETIINFINIEDRDSIGRPLFPDAFNDKIPANKVDENFGVSVITNYNSIKQGDVITFKWVGLDKDYIEISGSEYNSEPLTVSSSDVSQGFLQTKIPATYITPLIDNGIAHCSYIMKRSGSTYVSATAQLQIVSTDWSDGAIHCYNTTGIAYSSEEYPDLKPYNYVIIKGKAGKDAIIETTRGVFIDKYQGVSEYHFRFDSTGTERVKLYSPEDDDPFRPGLISKPNRFVESYSVAYEDNRSNFISSPISFNDYSTGTGKILIYSYNVESYADNITPIQVLLVLSDSVTSKFVTASVSGSATINHQGQSADIAYGKDKTLSFYIYNTVIETIEISINIDNSSTPLKLPAHFLQAH